MNYHQYYYHGTSGFKGSHCALNRISNILRSEKISLDCYSNAKDAKYVSHGKRIYLADLKKPMLPRLDSAFNLYITRGPSLVLDRNIEVIEPVYSYQYENQKHEWTDLYDEVRAFEDISLNHLKMVALPMDLIIKQYQIDLLAFLQSEDQSETFFLRNVIRPSLERLNFMKKAYDASKEFDSSLPVIDLLTETLIHDGTFDIIQNLIHSKNYEIYSLRQLTLKK